MRGIILYGPPASGKDTVTRALREMDRRYWPYSRLKVGRGRTVGYRMVAESVLNQLRAKGEIVWENRRYGATYAIDRASLLKSLSQCVPVLHLGQLSAIDAVVNSTPGAKWFTTYLWCPRGLAAKRIEDRDTGDTAERLRAWDETEPLWNADLVINTAETSPDVAAREIDRLVGLDEAGAG